MACSGCTASITHGINDSILLPCVIHGIHGPIFRISRNDRAALHALKDVLLGSTMEQAA